MMTRQLEKGQNSLRLLLMEHSVMKTVLMMFNGVERKEQKVNDLSDVIIR